MAKGHKKHKTDFNALAKSIVDQATDQLPPQELEQIDPDKDPKKAKSGRLGGLKGGKSRAKKLTAGERREIAKTAANARWRKRSKQ